MIRHLEALRLIRQTEPTRRKRVAFIAAVCRRLFPLLDRPYIAQSTKQLIDVMEEYTQNTKTADELDTACYKWRGLKLTGGTYFFKDTDPLTISFCQQFLTRNDEEHQKKLRTQDLPQEMKTRVHLGTQAIDNFACDFEFAKLRWREDDTEYIIRGCMAAALASGGIKGASELAHQCGILRDIFGDPPHKPQEFERAWRSSTVIALGQHMYESRDFSAMPILADALQDAGCENGDILNHCRDQEGVHVRGCWVVDLVLDKR
jgi:hypothetical protein